MKSRYLHMAFNFQNGAKTTELEPIINGMADDWLRYSPNCWVLWTSRPASDFLYVLRPYIGPNDTVLIAALDMSDRNGWLPQWMWEWIDKRRELGPPPPPTPPPSDFSSLAGLGNRPQHLGLLGGLMGLSSLGPNKKD